ncbi:hypothetical protein [Corynebacterium sp. HMSC071B10]|uniref:hypothetical protein n=1 Tax=Corynebacterium sp. HMSC071B10 TaxID=1739494 RepID=UPI0008A5C42D|nr:hypothetical protein [Corynebacterium sp. HMSC071B10]OFP37983.1 hypothetical protein HMPREF2990_01910 [Corynebacterium sp. HMSC071B10]
MSTEMSNVVGAWSGIALPSRADASEGIVEVAGTTVRFGELELDYEGPAASGSFTPESFTLRSVTTRVSGEAYVLAGSLFGQRSPLSLPEGLCAAVLVVEPGAEIAFACDEELAYAMVACTEGLRFDNVAVPAGSFGRTRAGHATHALKNTATQQAVAVVLGSRPASAR